MRWQIISFIYLNNGSMVKGLLFEQGGEGFKPSHLHTKLLG